MKARYAANMRKALEVILWVVERKPDADFHKILKVLFFADKLHMNRYGRPIVGGRYNADDYGPVCQPVYDLLKAEPLAVEMVERNGELPIEVHRRYRVRASRGPNLRLLSESDIAALADSYTEYGHISFDELVEISHADPAYFKAVNREMLYEDFLEDTPGKGERAADIAEVSRRFIEAARELGCDESEEGFAEIVRKVARAPVSVPEPSKPSKPRKNPVKGPQD